MSRYLPFLLLLAACVRDEPEAPDLSFLLAPDSDISPAATASANDEPTSEATTSRVASEPSVTKGEVVTETEVVDLGPVDVEPLIQGDERHEIHFSDLELGLAIQALAERGGLGLIVPTELAEPVTLSLTDATLDEALRSLLSRHELEVKDVGGVHHVVPRPSPGLETKVFKLASVDPELVREQLVSVLGDGSSVVVNTATDTVLVTAPPDALHRAENYLSVVDQPEKQVLIHARILEIGITDGEELGLRLAFEDISLDDTTASLVMDLLPTADSFETIVSADKTPIQGVLRALAELTRMELLANPRVLALDGRSAKIQIIEEVPYIGSTNTVQGETSGVGTTSIQQVSFKEVGVTLEVTPTIQRDGTVKLTLVTEVSEIAGFFEGVPAVDKRMLTNDFVVGDEETIVIGGLLKETDRRVVTGIPVLMDIPLIGPLFRSYDDETEKVSLAIFITPRIVEPGEVSGIASEYRAEWDRNARDWTIDRDDRESDTR